MVDLRVSTGRPTKIVRNQLFERSVILRRPPGADQLGTDHAPGGLRRPDARPPKYTASPCAGGTTTAGSKGNKLIFHGFGRSRHQCCLQGVGSLRSVRLVGDE